MQSADEQAKLINARCAGYMLPGIVLVCVISGTALAVVGRDEVIRSSGAGIVMSAVAGALGALTGGGRNSKPSPLEPTDDRPLLDLPQPLILAEATEQVELSAEDEYELIPVAEPVSSPAEFSEGFAYVPPKENKMGFSINRLVSIEEIRQNMAIANQKQDRN